jgi:hypothetical protein
MQWQAFYDVYLFAVHGNSSLSDVQKFLYLKSILKGEALSYVSSLPVSSGNYLVAWKSLKSRYMDPNRLTNAYLEALFDMNPISREAQAIRKFCKLITEYVGALSAVGHNVESWSVPMLFLLRRKLNPVWRERWEKIALNAVEPSLQFFFIF